MNIKEYRKTLKITSTEAADAISIPLRTYMRYEKDANYGNELKRKAIYDSLKATYEITEDKGILTKDVIIEKCKKVFEKYSNQISYCYLFGSYAKGYAKDTSDVDLCIETSLTGLNFVGLIEELRMELHKRVDLLRLSDMCNNIELVSEIMKDGIKIYG